jgi:hypothetical protein
LERRGGVSGRVDVSGGLQRGCDAYWAAAAGWAGARWGGNGDLGWTPFDGKRATGALRSFTNGPANAVTCVMRELTIARLSPVGSFRNKGLPYVCLLGRRPKAHASVAASAFAALLVLTVHQWSVAL